MSPLPKKSLFCVVGRRGFSLIEMLAVMAIIGIMLALLIPAVRTITSTAGRKSAVNTLMNTMEQARAAALSTGADVYVLLWRRKFPEQDAIMVLREPLDWNLKPDGTPEDTLIPLSRWIKIPEGVLLHNPNRGDNIFRAGLPPKLAAALGQSPSPVPSLGGNAPTKGDLGVVWYRPNGAIQQPLNNYARIIITEGVRGTDGNEAITSPSGTTGSFDIISLSRFTGRPQLDVSTIN